MRIRLNLLILVPVLLAFAALPIAAHPHMWTESKIEFSADDSDNLVLRLTWSFDLGFSELILVDYDKNEDHALSKSEVDAIYKGAFINVATFNYFSKIYVNDKEFAIKKVSDFEARLGPKGELVYAFSINLNTKLAKFPLNVGVMQFDATYYNDMSFENQDTITLPNRDISVSFKEVNVPKLAYWGGMIVPKKRVFSFAMK